MSKNVLECLKIEKNVSNHVLDQAETKKNEKIFRFDEVIRNFAIVSETRGEGPRVKCEAWKWYTLGFGCSGICSKMMEIHSFHCTNTNVSAISAKAYSVIRRPKPATHCDAGAVVSGPLGPSGTRIRLFALPFAIRPIHDFSSFCMVFETFFDSKSMDFEVESHQKT